VSHSVAFGRRVHLTLMVKKYYSIMSFDSSRPSLFSCTMRVVVRLSDASPTSFFFLSFLFPHINSCLALHIFIPAHQVFFHLFFSPPFLISICFILINFSIFFLFSIASSFIYFFYKIWYLLFWFFLFKIVFEFVLFF
jgi:hypothetical protein